MAWKISRRDFLKASGALVGGAALGAWPAWAQEKGAAARVLRFGLVTDVHYADRPNAGKRYYGESLKKLAECVERMNQEQVAFLAELGDFKDQLAKPTAETTLAFLRAAEAELAKFKGPRYHALGNHDMDSLSKQQFLANVTNTGVDNSKSYYSFDKDKLHFVVLDANFRADGQPYDSGKFDWRDANISVKEVEWLKADLQAVAHPTIILLHQCLEGGEKEPTIENAPAVRKILSDSKKVLAVFQGHRHSGGYQQIDGVHYYTLKAMVEGSGEASSSYATVDVLANGDLVVTGHRKAVSKKMPN